MALLNSADLIPYNEKDPEPFVFVSYSHDDVVKVEGVLRLMQRAGIRFWYDQMGAAIGGGMPWKEWVLDRLEKCSMFLCFLTNGVEQRREVLNEIEEAIERREKDPNFHVLFIFLEKMPARVFSNAGVPKIEEFIRKNQFIEYKGITDRFIKQLYAEDVFPDAVVRTEALELWQKRSKAQLDVDPAELFPENQYICETTFPSKAPSGDFYMVRPDEMDADAVCLICLDNQWCPPEFYDDPMFWAQGLFWEEGTKRQMHYQTQEIYRALLHHRQLVINRAFLYNSRVFEQWYDEKSADYQAFMNLLRDGSILVYLTTEKAPYDADHIPKFATENYHAWGRICGKLPVYCVRMDWRDEVINRVKVDQLLYHRFENFCLTMAENKHMQDDIAAAFGFDDAQRRAFGKIWIDVQLHAATREREEHPSYTRERFYRNFLVKSGTDVSDCILDIHKAFAPELKEIVDLQYGLNLPGALGIQPVFPVQGNLKDFYRSGQMLEEGDREISIEELSCAIGEFWPDFLVDDQLVDLPVISSISLEDVHAFRQMQEWKRYIRTVSNFSRRAHLQEVNYADISFVWIHFYEWMNAARDLTEARGITEWEKVKGAVSIIYHVGNYEIITVYHAGTNEVTIRTSFEVDASGALSIKDKIPDGNDHTVLLTIDYICADILRFDLKDNSLLSEQRLFIGMTAEKLSDVINGILGRFQAMEEAGQIALRWDQKPAEEIMAERKYRTKSVSSEWLSYVELLQNDMEMSMRGSSVKGSTAKGGAMQERNANEIATNASASYTLAKRIREKRQSGEWHIYTQLMDERQNAFAQNDLLMIVTDLEEICKYEMEHQGVKIGVRYESPFSLLVVDLVRDPAGNMFPYERLMPAVPRGAAVCIPVYDGKLVLIEQFRHALRRYQIAFPRGYGEPGIDSSGNAVKELDEELGVTVYSSKRIGSVAADSGVSGGKADVYYCEISEPKLKKGYEGIHKLILLTPDELKEKITNGEIDDGYTLAAMEMLDCM